MNPLRLAAAAAIISAAIILGLGAPDPALGAQRITPRAQAPTGGPAGVALAATPGGAPPGGTGAAGSPLSPLTLVVVASIVTAGITMAIGTIGPGLGEGRAVAAAMDALARQPDASGTITRTLFVGLAMIESIAIYALVIALILLFANPLLALFPGG